MTRIRNVVLVGLFSAKVRDHQARLDVLQARLTALGVRVTRRFVQRRGVSRGGVRLMDTPLSRRFLLGPGKVDEVADACAADGVDAVVVVNELSDYQRRWLSARLDRPVLTATDVARCTSELVPPAHSGGRSTARHPRRR